jgi:RDD family
MYCNYCRALNPKDAIYCSACGRTISTVPNDLQGQFSTASTPTEPAMAPSLVPMVTQGEVQTSEPISFGTNGVRTTPSEPITVDAPVYGTLGHRFTAYFADLVVIYFIALLFHVAASALNLPVDSEGGEPQVVWFGLLILYMIIAQVTYHTTFGKYVHGLEVRSANPARKYPAFWRILVRKSLGRFLSSLLWGLGYWMAVKKPRVQAWSDELAGTVVTTRPTNRVLVRALTAFIVVAFIADVGVTGYGSYKEDRDKQYAALQKEMQTAVDAVVAARKDVDDKLASVPTVNTWADFATWQETMKSLKYDLDVWEARIDQVQTLLQKGISKDLAASDEERTQFIKLKEVYDIRRQQAEKMRQEADLVISCQPTASAYGGLRNDLQLLDSDIAAMNDKASRLLAEANIK